MTGPNFYKIDFEREVVLQGKSSTFITINRNDDVLNKNETLYVMFYPNTRTFESAGVFEISQSSAIGGECDFTSQGFIDLDLSSVNTLSLNNIGEGLYVKNTQDYMPNSEGPVTVEKIDFLNTTSGIVTKVTLSGPTGSSDPFVGPTGSTATKILNVGFYSDVDKNNWKFNTVPLNEMETVLYSVPGTGTANDYTEYENPFDGSVYGATGGANGGFTGTGFVSRSLDGWSSSSILSSSSTLKENRGVTFRIDYEGNQDSHLKLNMLIFRYDPTDPAYGSVSQVFPLLMPEGITGPNNPFSYATELFGFKSGSSSGLISENIDYQELHIFGYTDTTVRTTRTNYQNNVENAVDPIYDDRASYGVLKTNPKITGNVKLTVDSKGELSLNSFDANPLLADSKYKRFPVSPESMYQRDLYSFFKNTPNELIYELYQADDQYQNTKRDYYQQYDNFYNYGVEQLASKFYDEDFNFLAPLWMRKVLPDYFVIFRADHPASIASYSGSSSDELFKEVFKDARIIKTFDMRETSKLGKYIRKIVNDPRFIERPIEVSFDQDVPTTWNGISYKDGTITGKGELLSSFWSEDRPIKALEDFITSGFERNGIISTNLINLEFLFDDPEASIYSINRYFGMYVSEVQLAEFELASSVLGKIPGQTPPPKPGVDGEPYSTRTFIQSNTGGIQLPIDYYHSTTYVNNTSIVPFYQGTVLGKFPLPAMVDDPLRIFYVKDRDDVFKRVISEAEVDYGFTGTTEYRRVTQLELFDTQEDISKYSGPVQIISQSDTTLLNAGQSQLVINLLNQANTGKTIADEEVLEISVKNYNDPERDSDYYFQVSAVGGTATTFTYFQDQQVTTVSSSFTQPSSGGTASVSFLSTQSFVQDETLYIVSGGYYKIVSVASSTSAVIKNLGNPENAAAGTTISNAALAGSYPTGIAKYTYTALGYKLDIDNNITLDLEQGYAGSSSNYSLLDSYRAIITYPEFNLSVLNGTSGIDVDVKSQYTQYRWKMTANPVGLLKGKAWSFPVEDPNGYDFISNFSNEGTTKDVAVAISSCINSFANSPVFATPDGERIILRSKLKPLDGNTIEFSRHMVDGKSYIKNLGFYEDGNAKIDRSIKTISIPSYTSSDELDLTITKTTDLFAKTKFLVRILKTPGGTNVIVRSGIDASSAYTAENTGTYQSFFTTNSTFSDSSIPFTIGMDAVTSGSYQNFVVELTVGGLISQKFVGGTARKRARAKITTVDGERYYQNRRVTVASTLASGSSSVIVSSIEGIYVGAPVGGEGIPADTKVLQVSATSNLITISNAATSTGSFTLNFGELSILNNTSFLQQWFQTAKSQFSRLQPWEVQGKYVYSLPYLEEPVFDSKNNIISYNDSSTYTIIEVENENQEFYLSDENRIVAYRMYRPTFGMFSMFPIKEFDFDFFLSDYSYSPVLETFRYFFNETIQQGEYLELPSDENFVVVPQIDDPADNTGETKLSWTGSYQFNLEGYNDQAQSWNTLSEALVTSTSSTAGFVINTYTPFYRYDEYEHPQRYDDESYYLIRGTGYRNFERSLITTKSNSQVVSAVDVKKFRLKYVGGTVGATALPFLNVQKSDFSQDQDVREFGGFVGLTDILNQNDQQEIAILKDNGKYVESYLRQQLQSEYDRLRENFTKDFSTFSRVVPFVNKWVQEGTDARDNYYRLNTSRAFGITNFSPDDSVDFAEPIILSHEFPYLDTVPKDYPESNVGSSRSYMFAKLSDIASNGKSWYDLITSDNTNDWFLKYFAVGYPTELDYYGIAIPKPRDERFTFYTFNPGLTRAQTLFRGVKLQVVDIDDTKQDLPEIPSSTRYDQYKFAAIQRTVPYKFYESESPIGIEVIKNDKYKSITLIITRRTHDYRVQSGLSDYTFSYAAIDNLKNNNQQQYKFDSATTGITELSTFAPYGSTGTSYTEQVTYRPRQLFFGGGYLEEGDPKLSGAIDTSTNLPSYNSGAKYINFNFVPADAFFPFVASDEINPFVVKYPIGNTSSTYPFSYDFNSTYIIPRSFNKESFLNKIVSTGFNNANSTYYVYDFTDTRAASDSILVDSAGFSSPSRYPYFRNTTGAINSNEGLYTYTYPKSAYPFVTLESFNIGGGVNFYENSKNLFTFANIKKNINSDNGLVKYYEVTDAGKVPAQDFKLRIVAADQIKKTGVLNYVVDQDRPPEYANAPVIGYDLVNTNQNELVIRHRGYYEPKAMDIISFWVREDEEVTRHFAKDFILSNTRISSLPNYSGVIRNYGINKVAAQEILKISEGSAYKSVYEFIHEIAIDRKDVQVLNSTWDAGYFRRYTDLDIYENIDGYVETKEFKSFLGSKAMNVPKSLDVQTFTAEEALFEVSQPSQSNGLVPQVSSTRPTLSVNLSLSERLVRFLKDGIDNSSNDDFSWMNSTFDLNLTTSELDTLKDSYIRENLLPLYDVADVILYAVQKDGIPIFVSNLSESQKSAAGYRQDKDCEVSKISKFEFLVRKTLDTKTSYGYTVSVTFKRI